MKKIVFIIVCTASAFVLNAQSVEQGNQQLYYERYGSAVNTFQQVLQKDPSNAGAWYGLTKAYLLQDDLKKASDSIQAAPEVVRSDPYYKVAVGAVLLQQQNSEATSYLQQALKETREKDAGVLAAVAEAHINAQSGDANYAVELLKKALKRDKHNAALYVQLGDAYTKLHNGSEAYKAYQKALEENDSYAKAYDRLGDIFLSQKNADLYVDYFKKAVAADPNYLPALYSLYRYEFYHDPAKAMAYYKDYAAKSDHSLQNEYDLADLLYLNKQYSEAIQKATAIINAEGDSIQPRLYKLIGYSYAGVSDTAKAITYMKQYFEKEADSNLVSKDFLAMGEFYGALQGQDSLAITYLEKGVELEKDSATQYELFKKLADKAKENDDYTAQAKWLGKYYTGNNKANNLDLFNWGIAQYRAENYAGADSVFSMYITKYPEQSFGYYWQAKSKALQDKEMVEGLAVPAYEKLIEVLQRDTTDANFQKWIVEAYSYLAAYAANTEKNYAEAVDYFEKVLQVDAENESAKKYIAILQKNIADNDGS
jgi:tetratricopeptide (TPR) repeat protein